MAYRQTTGKKGEQLACEYLQEHGYSIIDTNFRSRYGEIDIIAVRNNILTFIEVKARSTILKGKPYEAVGNRKLLHLRRAIEYYLRTHSTPTKYACGVISIILSNKPEISYYDDVATYW